MRLITVAIHTYERALALRTMLENEGIEVVLSNVNLDEPTVSSGVRVRIHESDLPLALRIIENAEVFTQAATTAGSHSILVPIDFSGHSEQAVRLGLDLAARHKTGITLLHSYIDPFLPGNMQLTDNLTYEIADAGTRQQLLAAAEARMNTYVNALKSDMKAGKAPMVKITSKVMEGVPEDVIVDYTKIDPPLLVVMGTRRNDRKERELIGSVTAEVLDQGRFSVFSVPEGAPVCPNPAKILFLSNLDQEDILAADTVARIFPDTVARITMMHLGTRKSYGERKRHLSADALLDYCKSHYGQFTFNYVPVDKADPMADISRLLAEEGFDLIVVPNRKRNALSRLFNPGVAHKILFQTNHPMLVIPV